MNVKKLKCRWFGHDIRNDYPYQYYCPYCNTYVEYDEFVRGGYINRLVYNIKAWCKFKINWFNKCPDCGKRFGRHDENYQHLPF
jgi:endogenous inhibitor of DNA gyrase (YacG/DUF329 family)